MKRPLNPLAAALRRGLFDRGRRSEVGDTLIEVLVTITILGGCALALIITFGTAITASTDHRNLAVNSTILRNIQQAAYYQLAQQPSLLFQACATAAQYQADNIQYGQPAGYTVTINQGTPIEYWNGTSFVTTCPAPNAPQLITLNVTAPNGSNDPSQFVVDGVGVLPTIVTVTGVTPPSGSQGATNLLLTIAGTGFQNGATASIVGATGITMPDNPTFVSPTELQVFVDIASNASVGSYDVSVTNPLQSAVSSTSPLFTVIQSVTTGMHVSTMVANTADPIKYDPDENAQYGWDAWDTITVESGTGAPLQGVTVNGTWSIAPVSGYSLPTLPIGTSTITCVTNLAGTCTVYYGWQDLLHYVTATFTMSSSTSTNPATGGLVLNGYTYAPGSNAPNALQVTAPCAPEPSCP
jgi:type II secretory pathway pseudopilin PulG